MILGTFVAAAASAWLIGRLRRLATPAEFFQAVALGVAWGLMTIFFEKMIFSA